VEALFRWGKNQKDSSVRLRREGLSASSAAYVRRFYPLEIRKNGGKTVKKLIFHHARQLWLQMVANGMKKEMQIQPCPEASIANLIDGLL
jgi:hypothetical protein